MMRKSNWSELQYDLLVLIGKRLNLIEDYLNFSSVCKSWRSVATKDNFNSDLPRVPWLMLAEEEGVEYRQFFSLYNGMILKKRIPKARGKGCVESMGWLITVGKVGELNLLHPFSGVQIELPHQSTSNDYERYVLAILFADKRSRIRKAVLSANPSRTSDYVLMVIEVVDDLKFWLPGDLVWTMVSHDIQFAAPYSDIVYYKGQFYAIDSNGRVKVCNIDGPEPPHSQVVASLPSYADPHSRRGDSFYIVESLGSLFIVVRQYYHARYLSLESYITPLIRILDHDDQNLIGKEHEQIMVTTKFKVFQLDLAAGELSETKDLGDVALFVGSNASISVQASQFPRIKPNHIYFTDDVYKYCRSRDGGGLDMGVFNLTNGSIEAHYDGVSRSHVCPPTWVTPTLY